MKFCIVVLLFVVTAVTAVHGVAESQPLACVDKYNSVATELSKRVTPEIRENLVKAIETLKNSKSCILRDSTAVECAGDTIFVDSVSETKKAIELSTGQLQKLFIKFNELNQEALKQIQSLVGVKDASQQVISVVCTLYNGRTKLIQAYFAQQSTNPTA